MTLNIASSIEISATKSDGVTELTDDQLYRYARHLLLPEIDYSGQLRLLNSSALIIGLGGLGGPAALYLAASGVGHLICCDDDTVDNSNLQRQVHYDVDSVGRKKTTCTLERLRKINPQNTVSAIDHRMSSQELQEQIRSVDIVIDCSDNFPTRYTLNEICVREQKPLVIGSAVGFTGQVLLVNSKIESNACLACVFPEQESAEPVPSHSCAENGVFSPLVGVIGSLQAGIAINTLLGINNNQMQKLTIVNLADFTIRQVKIMREPACRVCNFG